MSPHSKDKTTVGRKVVSYSDGPQQRDFLKSQACGTVPILTRATISNPDDYNKTIIITGSNTGLGFEAARQFLDLGCISRLILACRSVSKGEEAKAKLLPSARNTNIEVWQVDMASRASIAMFADRCDRDLDRLDAIVLNAGVLPTVFENAGPEEGSYEMTLLVNVVGTMLLAALMVPILRSKSSPIPPRITIVGSAVQYMVNYQCLVDGANSKEQSVLQHLSDKSKWPAEMGTDRYYLSKGVLQMVVQRLAEQIQNSTDRAGKPMVVLNCVAPGYCRTELFRDNSTFASKIALKLIARDSHIGARALLVGAVGVEGGEKSHGHYMSEGVVKDHSSYFDTLQGKEIGRMMWEEITQVIEQTRPGVMNIL